MLINEDDTSRYFELGWLSSLVPRGSFCYKRKEKTRFIKLLWGEQAMLVFILEPFHKQFNRAQH